MHIIGDVSGRTCLIMDDMVDTANTLCKAAQALKAHGAERVLALCNASGLSGAAIRRIKASDLDELVVTDTIPLSDEARACDRIRVVSHRQPAGGNHASHQQRRVGQLAVCGLSFSALPSGGAFCNGVSGRGCVIFEVISMNFEVIAKPVLSRVPERAAACVTPVVFLPSFTVLARMRRQ